MVKGGVALVRRPSLVEVDAGGVRRCASSGQGCLYIAASVGSIKDPKIQKTQGMHQVSQLKGAR